jgi:hypothetical protein
VRVIGHDRVLVPLRDQLPPVSLFQGPRSVGKWTAAVDLARHHGIDPSDLRTYRRLDVAAAREILQFLSVRSFVGPKAVVCRLDGASDQAVNSLLKILEEPPPAAHFVMCASSRPLLTVMSRSSRYAFGYLTEEEVASILVGVLGWADEDAEWAAARSGGQIERALGAGDLDATKQAVMSLLKGAADGDVALVANALVKFAHDTEHPDQPSQLLRSLRQWAIEARTGRWRAFSASESYGLHLEPGVVDRVLRVTTTGARPRVAARAAMMPIAVARSGR